MRSFLPIFFTFIATFSLLNNGFAWEGMPMPKLHIQGRYLKDSSGHIVNLHGFAQTYSPWFNEQNSKWTNYDVNGCLTYNKGIIDKIMAAGWKVNFMRLHMDPYWSNTPGCTPKYHEAHNCFNETRFKKYLDEVFIPMAEYAISKGLYVVMRPPGVSPENIAIGDDYHQYLIKVWGIVSKHPKIMNNPYIMFELANEPINILGTDNTYGANNKGHFDNLKIFFQTIVDTIRVRANNIIWVPGLGYQSLYAGYANNPIEGENIGYAVHVYPGWFNSGKGYELFQRGWDKQVQPVADFAPIMVTEMDWAPERHGKSWGKDSTGTAGGNGFGANFKKITDDCGNVSWLLFTEPHLLAEYGNPNAAPDVVDFLTDPEACPTPVYNWFIDYASAYSFNGISDDYITMVDIENDGDSLISILNKSSVGLKINAFFADGHVENVSSIAQITVSDTFIIKVARGRIFALHDGQASINVAYTDTKNNKMEISLQVISSTFPLTEKLFNPDIWENGTFDEATHTLKTGPWGLGGWQYDGIDLSEYKYLVARLGSSNNSDVTFRIFDVNNYWGSPASYKFGNKKQIVVFLNQAKKDDGSLLNSKHIYIVGFWSNGVNPFVIDTVFLSNSNEFAPPVINAKNFQGTEINKLDGFYYEIGKGPSSCKILVVSGEFLKSSIFINAPTGFEIALDSTQSFFSSINLTPNNGRVFDTNVYVRMKSGLTNNYYSGNLTITSDGAISKIVALSGNIHYATAVKYCNKTDSELFAVEYYTITGERLKTIEGLIGVFVQKNIMLDGTINTKKIVKINK